MTREEAIMELNRFSGTTQLKLSANFWTALEMAIKALEKKQCNDAISRKAVLNTLDSTDKFLDETRTVESYKTLLEECYKNLPSVTPVVEREKIGKAIGEIIDKSFISDIYNDRTDDEIVKLDDVIEILRRSVKSEK